MTNGLSFEIEKEILRIDQMFDEWMNLARQSGYLEDGEVHQMEQHIATTVLDMKETLWSIKEAEQLMVRRRIYSEPAIEEAAAAEAEARAKEEE